MKQIYADWSDLYQLAVLAYSLPTKELVEGLLDGRFQEDLEACLTGIACKEERIQTIREMIAKSTAGRDSETLLDVMRCEYTRLFTNPKFPMLTLYESIFVDDAKALFLTKKGRDAELRYKAAGMQMKVERQEPADYLPTELEFVRMQLQVLGEKVELEELAGEACCAGSDTETCGQTACAGCAYTCGAAGGETYGEIRARLEDFCQAHIVDWLPQLAEAIKVSTMEGVYWAFADLLEILCGQV